MLKGMGAKILISPVWIFRIVRHHIFSWYLNRRATRDVNIERTREEEIAIGVLPKGLGVPLTAEEKASAIALWGKDLTSFKEFEVYKRYRGFDPRFLPFHLYLPLISRRLNNYRYAKILEHKGLLGRLTHGSIKFPKCVVRCINGEYYSDDMVNISYEDAIAACNKEASLVFKLAEDSSGGHGVKLLSKSKLSGTVFIDEVKKLLQNTKNDFVVQECMRQHEVMEKFNPSSINTLRIQSLYLNGRFSIGAIVLRMGTPGSFVDNLCSGGILVGVDRYGNLGEVGYNARLELFKRHGEITFKGQRIDIVPEILKMIEEDHTHQFSICKFIGWDIMIDENNMPICLEVNTSQNGVLPFQICCGPVFGERTQEVIDYCKDKHFHYGRAIGSY